MKTIISIFLLATFSICVHAKDDLKTLDDLQNKIVVQSTKIRDAFDKYGLDIKSAPYQTVWEEEFRASDQVEIFRSAIELFKKIGNTNDGIAKFEAYRITSLATNHCHDSLSKFDNAKRLRWLRKESSANRRTCLGPGRLIIRNSWILAW